MQFQAKYQAHPVDSQEAKILSHPGLCHDNYWHNGSGLVLLRTAIGNELLILRITIMNWPWPASAIQTLENIQLTFQDCQYCTNYMVRDTSKTLKSSWLSPLCREYRLPNFYFLIKRILNHVISQQTFRVDIFTI